VKYKVLYNILLEQCEENRLSIINHLFSKYYGFKSSNEMNLKKQDKRQLTVFINNTKGFYQFDKLEQIFLYNIQLGMGIKESIESVEL